MIDVCGFVAPADKNKNLIIDYIAATPPDIFFDLVKKYKINIEKIIG